VTARQGDTLRYSKQWRQPKFVWGGDQSTKSRNAEGEGSPRRVRENCTRKSVYFGVFWRRFPIFGWGTKEKRYLPSILEEGSDRRLGINSSGPKLLSHTIVHLDRNELGGKSQVRAQKSGSWYVVETWTILELNPNLPLLPSPVTRLWRSKISRTVTVDRKRMHQDNDVTRARRAATARCSITLCSSERRGRTSWPPSWKYMSQSDSINRCVFRPTWRSILLNFVQIRFETTEP